MKHSQIYPEQIYHIYNRGNQKMNLFSEHKDYIKFQTKMFEYAKKFNVEILAYCLMPNHFHIISKEPEKSEGKWRYIAHFLHRVQTSYAMYFCKKNYKYSGHVFQGRYKIKHVDSEIYFLALMDYVHQNPVRKKLVSKAEDWPYCTLRG